MKAKNSNRLTHCFHRYIPSDEAMDEYLCFAEINLDKGDTPHSVNFKDIYFSIENGYEETAYVFLQHNQLPERFCDHDTFVIAETGFGTGLNFLVTLECWLAATRPEQQLYYFSTEKYPLQKQDLSKLVVLFLKRWPQLTSTANCLLDAYPFAKDAPAFNNARYSLPLLNGRVILELLTGDAIECFHTFKEQIPEIDAWYLDGFAPAKNPSMWQDTLYAFMRSKAHKTTTFSTFTAASAVRRGLEKNGFKVMKARGYGNKREMLYGAVSNY